MTIPNVKTPFVGYLDQTDPIPCPYGDVRRVVTGGAGGVANVHVVSVTRGAPHLHTGYDEVYYVLGGSGRVTLGEETVAVRPGAVVVVPAGLAHSVEADGDEPLEFIIFGTPACSIDDDRARPRGVR